MTREHDSGLTRVRDYHTRTKHRLDRYAAGPDFLDWEQQPDPFRAIFDSGLRIRNIANICCHFDFPAVTHHSRFSAAFQQTRALFQPFLPAGNALFQYVTRRIHPNSPRKTIHNGARAIRNIAQLKIRAGNCWNTQCARQDRTV